MLLVVLPVDSFDADYEYTPGSGTAIRQGTTYSLREI